MQSIHWADRRWTSPASQHCSLTRLGANGTHTDAPNTSIAEESNANTETCNPVLLRNNVASCRQNTRGGKTAQNLQ
eukprot:8274537-Pyramimonas_sp.AAC.1